MAPPTVGRSTPLSLMLTTGLVGLEAAALVGYGVAELTWVTASRAALGLTTTVFFLAYGAALAFCAWHLVRLRSWARSPIVFAQLVQLGLAWSFHAAPTTWVAAVLAAVAVAVVVSILLPASTAALAQSADT